MGRARAHGSAALVAAYWPAGFQHVYPDFAQFARHAWLAGELLAQPHVSGDVAIDAASAHLYEQSRRDAFTRLAARDRLLVDAEPERLGVELVNQYHAVKRAGLV